MKSIQPSSQVFSNVYVMACDDNAFAVFENHIHRHNTCEIIPFVREEMVGVCHLKENSLIEIKDHKNKVVYPFSIMGRALMLSPHFFGQGLSLFVNGKRVLELTIEFWHEFAYEEGDLLH